MSRLWPTLAGGLFGFATARIVLDTWPLLAGPLPRWPLAALLALACAAAGFGLLYRLPGHSLLPLLLPGLVFLAPAPFPPRDWVLIVGAVGGTAAMLFAEQASTQNRPHGLPVDAATLGDQPPSRRFRITFRSLYPLSLALIAGALYLATLAPTVGEADTFEFQVNVIRLGISHGSGYPLYILLAKLFSLLPLGGTAAFRINLSSAFFGVAAALACYGLGRALGAARPAAWLAGLALAVSIGLWSRAVEAEVYTLHVALVGLLLWLSLKLEALGAETGTRQAGKGSAPDAAAWRRWLALTSFVLGLSFTNHLTTGLLLPALCIAISPNLWRAVMSGGNRLHVFVTLVYCLVAFGLGLSLYAYLPIRWPAVNNGEVMTWEMFTRFFTGAEAHGALRLDAWYTDFSRYAIVARKSLEQFGPAGAMLAAAGLTALARRQPLRALATAAAWGAFAFFGLSFYVPDPDFSSFLLPAHLVQAAWMAVGVDALLHSHWLQTRLRAAYPWALSAGYGALLVLPATLVGLNFPQVSQRNDWREYELGRYILSQPLSEGATILADSELIAPLYYLQVAEGLRPDLDIVVLPAEAYYRAELDARVSAGRAVYLGRYLPHLTDVYYLRSVGPLTEARLEPAGLPEGATPVGLNFGGLIRLHAFRLDADTAPADGALRVTLYWQALEPPPANYRIALRLVNAAGEPVLTGAARVPVGQMYNTAAWPTHDVVADFQSLALHPALAPGRYFLQVAVSPAFSPAGLALEWGNTWLTLSDVFVAPPAREPEPESLARIRFGPATWLVGYGLPESATPGSPIAVTLYWQSTTEAAATVCLADACQVVTVRPAPSTTVTRTTLPAPPQPAIAALRVEIAGANAECGWWPLPAGEGCAVASLKVAGEAPAHGAVNFNNTILLESVAVETPRAARGQVVVVSTQWRGLAPMDADYTVFVHLLGPDGLVHGQEDRWPVQGTLPTTQWQVNMPVTDRFEIRVPEDAPSGDYIVEVGWYLLATLERLPVIEDGVAIDDKFVTGGLTIE